MQLETVDRELTMQGSLSSSKFAISETNQVHIMGILRDGLYTDRILAVLREYSSNAWDAHRDAGKQDLPIEIVLPTTFKPFLTIRDFGKGLSEHGVLHVYTQYGESTKRESNEVVGSLGIGCKAGFSYSDTFTVTSWHDGMKKVYAAVLDLSSQGEIHKIHEEPCETTETGIEIQIPVQPQDIYSFEERARALFPYFNPLPKINIELPRLEGNIKKNGVFLTRKSYGDRQWMAVMGCIPYKVSLSQIQTELVDLGIYDAVVGLSGWVYFDIGEVRMSANREELRYTQSTKAALGAKFKALIDEYITDSVNNISNSAMSDWEKRLDVIFLKKSLNIGFINVAVEWQLERVKFVGAEPPKTFTVWHNKEEIRVSKYSKIVVKDNPKFDLSKYDFGDDVIVVVPVEDSPLEEARKELAQLLQEAHLTGVPFLDLSTLSQNGPTLRAKRGKSAYAAKYKVSLFQLKEQTYFRPPWSNCWDIVKRTPEKEDVYVILENFRVRDTKFYEMFSEDLRLAQGLKLTMPPVYGYRKAALKEGKTILGTPYLTWRKEFFANGWAPEHDLIFLAMEWHGDSATAHDNYARRQLVDRLNLAVPTLVQTLGAKHPVTKFFSKGLKAMQLAQTTPELVTQTKTLMEILQKKNSSSKVREQREKLVIEYPMFQFMNAGLRGVLSHTKLGVEYIKLVDSSKKEVVP